MGQDPEVLRRLLRAKDRMDGASHEDWPVRRLARVSGVSEAHFARSFKEAFGVPPHRYLVGVRLRRAAEALRRGTRVTAAAQNSGFVNLGQFIRQFHRAHGVTPSRYRRASGVAQREERL